MIPEFLNEFKDEIEKYKLNTIKIKATPLAVDEILSLTQSKFLGHPFLPVHVNYPKDKNGLPMILLAQINFGEVPALEDYPAQGILQLFVSATHWYDMNDYRILFHEDLTKELQSDFSFLTPNLYKESPIDCEHKLDFSKEPDYGGTADFRLPLIFNKVDFFDYYENLSESQQEEMDIFFDGTGHKIGGYAYFTQEDPREYNTEKVNDILLLQIDTDDHIMFGDCGVAHVFINREDLKNKDFGKAYFNWDCC
jgi:uncharacterized protein YwqG